MGDVAGVHRLRGDDNDAMPTSHCASLDQAAAPPQGDPLLFEPGTQHRYSILGLGSRQRGGRGGGRGAVQPFHGPAGAPAPRHGADRCRGDRGPRGYRAWGCASTGLLLRRGGGAFLPRRRTSFDSPRDAEAWPVVVDPIAAFQTPTRLVSGASTTYALGWTVNSVRLAGEPARIVRHRGSSGGRHGLAPDVPGSRPRDCRRSQRGGCQGVDPFALEIAEAFTSSGIAVLTQPNAFRSTCRLFGTAVAGSSLPSISSDTQPLKFAFRSMPAIRW